MSLDLSELTNRPQCDEVLSSLEAELAGYQIRDNNQGHAETRSAHTDATKAKRLADVQSDIDLYEYNLAKPGLSDDRREEYASKLRRAIDKRDNLNDRSGGQKPTQRVLAAVDAQQVDAQVAVLTAAIQQVRAHRDTLSA